MRAGLFIIMILLSAAACCIEPPKPAEEKKLSPELNVYINYFSVKKGDKLEDD